MRNLSGIRSLLDELERRPADAMEDQDLDFKEWNIRSMADAVRLVVEMGDLYGQWRRGCGEGTAMGSLRIFYVNAHRAAHRRYIYAHVNACAHRSTHRTSWLITHAMPLDVYFWLENR
jgi:hypothetical protein